MEYKLSPFLELEILQRTIKLCWNMKQKIVLEKITTFQFGASNENLKIGVTVAQSQYLRF